MNTESEHDMNRLVKSSLLAGAILFSIACNAQSSDPDDRELDARVERAITSGMRWLAERQVVQEGEIGHWESPKFSTAVTSLAGLALLANGQLPDEGEHGVAVRRALNYIVRNRSGVGLGSGGAFMYENAMSVLFVLSCLGTFEDREKNNALSEWCHEALDMIYKAQEVDKSPSDKGGWRYHPASSDSDLSVTAWQLLVLHGARQCGFAVRDSSVRYAMNYINSGFTRIDETRSGYIYRPGHQKEAEPGVTGTSVLVKSIFEEEIDMSVYSSLEYLKDFKVGWGGPQYRGFFFFSTFYMLQGFFQVGGDEYALASRKVKQLLVREQKGDGHWPYPPGSRAERQGVGEVYPTAMAVLILSLDKQYLPIFQRQRNIH